MNPKIGIVGESQKWLQPGFNFSILHFLCWSVRHTPPKSGGEPRLNKESHKGSHAADEDTGLASNARTMAKRALLDVLSSTIGR